MWLGFAISQLYLLARLWVRLVFFASETALLPGPPRTRRLRRQRPVPPLREPPIVEPRQSFLVIAESSTRLVLLAPPMLAKRNPSNADLSESSFKTGAACSCAPAYCGDRRDRRRLGLLRVRLHDWTRPLALLVLAVASRAWAVARHARAGRGSATRRCIVLRRDTWDARDAARQRGRLLCTHHVRVAGGLDSYGYVSTAQSAGVGQAQRAAAACGGAAVREMR